ncbi:MAG: hypothetical protein RLZZ401_1770 [Pseudomonadota bacterium]|jgi:DNA-binding transcriptional LysR family regulator
METSYLRTFMAVLESGSMSEAARRLGVPLLRRAGRTVGPTEAGHRLAGRAQALMTELGSLRSAVADPGGTLELDIGATNTMLNGPLPIVLEAVVREHPAARIVVRTGLTAELYDEVVRGRLDAAFCLHPAFVLPKTLQWVPLREERLVVLAGGALLRGTVVTHVAGDAGDRRAGGPRVPRDDGTHRLGYWRFGSGDCAEVTKPGSNSVVSQRLKQVCLHWMVSLIRGSVVEAKQLGDRDGFEHVQVQLSEDVVKTMRQVQLEHLHVVHLAMADVDEARNGTAQIQQRVQFHRRLESAQQRAIERVVGVQRAGRAHQVLGQLGVRCLDGQIVHELREDQLTREHGSPWLRKALAHAHLRRIRVYRRQARMTICPSNSSTYQRLTS